MTDVDILIPVFIDNEDRISNLKNSVKSLRKHNFLKIYVREYYYDSPKIDNLSNGEIISYSNKKITENYFNKMKCINELFELSSSPIIAIYDVDVLIFSKSLFKVIKMFEDGYQVVYPYNGCFYNIPKFLLKNFLQSKKIDLNECILWNTNSYGGCVFFKRETFKEGGKCNPYFKNVGYDDNEIFIRFQKLGYKIGRTDTPILHMDHERSQTAFGNNEYEKYNAEIFSLIMNKNKDELMEEIKKWNEN